MGNVAIAAFPARRYAASVDVRPTVAHLLRIQRDERRAARARAARARERLPALVRVLVDELGARRVVLFGSLLSGELEDGSDVDVAVEGLAPDRYWEGLWRCSEAVGRHVDLVPLEDASQTLRDRIAREGEVLHE